MKQCHDSSGDCKFSLPANETLGEETAMILLSLPDFIINAWDWVVIPAKTKNDVSSACSKKNYQVIRKKDERFLSRTVFLFGWKVPRSYFNLTQLLWEMLFIHLTGQGLVALFWAAAFFLLVARCLRAKQLFQQFFLSSWTMKPKPVQMY